MPMIKGEPGDDAEPPSEEYLLSLIKPLIPQIKQPADGKTPTTEELLGLIRPLIPKIKEAQDGRTPTEGELLNLILRVMPKMEDREIHEVEEVSGADIVAKINDLEIKPALQIDAKHIKNLPKYKEVRQFSRGKGSEILTTTETIDDSNVTFTFSRTPREVVVNGASYITGGGCTISGGTVTLDNPVGTGGSIYAKT